VVIRWRDLVDRVVCLIAASFGVHYVHRFLGHKWDDTLKPFIVTIGVLVTTGIIAGTMAISSAYK
jgi:hypothetical protein